MTEKEFYEQLLYFSVIENKKITFNDEHIVINDFTGDKIELINCNISANKIVFVNLRNEELIIRFKDCEINAQIIFINCIIQGIYFEGTKSLKSLCRLPSFSTI
jgi:hypothetical protein